MHLDSGQWASLIEYWRSSGTTIVGGASDLELANFEFHSQVCIPGEFRSYLRAVNGMLEYESDAQLFEFWPISRIRSVSEECPTYGHPEAAQNIFVFADFMIRSHEYGLEMGPDKRETSNVFLLGGARPQLVASSFSEFIGMYLRDDRTIYAK